MQHGQIAQYTTQYNKPHQVQLSSDVTCSLIFRLELTVNKLESIGKAKLITATDVNTANVSTTIIKLVIKYLSKSTVSSAKQSPYGKYNRGL